MLFHSPSLWWRVFGFQPFGSQVEGFIFPSQKAKEIKEAEEIRERQFLPPDRLLCLRGTNAASGTPQRQLQSTITTACQKETPGSGSLDMTHGCGSLGLSRSLKSICKAIMKAGVGERWQKCTYLGFALTQA